MSKYEGMTTEEILEEKKMKSKKRVERYRSKMKEEKKIIARIKIMGEHKDWFYKMATLSREGKLDISKYF